MDDILSLLIRNKKPRGKVETDNMTRETLEELILVGLSKTDFFDRAFYFDPTMLIHFRRFCRYTDELRFIMKERDTDFDIEPYLKEIQKFMSAFEIDLGIKILDDNHDNIKQAILSARIRELQEEPSEVKISINVDSVDCARYEYRYETEPFFHCICVSDISTLKSETIHSVLCNNVDDKSYAMDLFDFSHCSCFGKEYNFDYLKCKLLKSGLDENSITPENIRKMLLEKYQK